MKKIGLTGGIGAGKSAVSKYLEQLGACILDADEAAHAVVMPGEIGLERICAAFGNDLLNEDGTLNRKKLASIVFNDKKALECLNAITHPLIREWLDKKAQSSIAQNPDVILVHDAPLLIESGTYKQVDQVWVVTTRDDIRLERIMQRDHCTAEEAKRRIANQMPEEEKKKYADVIIDNSGTMQMLFEQVEKHYRSFCEGNR